jgi:hypothetical protein
MEYNDCKFIRQPRCSCGEQNSEEGRDMYLYLLELKGKEKQERQIFLRRLYHG